MSKEQEIAQLVKQIAHKGINRSMFITAEVQSIEGETCTISYDGLELTGVRLSAVEDGNTNNLRITPMVGSMVLCADLSDGQMRDMVIIGWSEVDTIEISGGKNKGLVKVQALIDLATNIYNDFQSLVTQLSTHPVAGNGAQLGLVFNPSTKKPKLSDFENEKFKH